MKTFEDNCCPVCQNKLTLVISDANNGKFFIAQDNYLDNGEAKIPFEIKDNTLYADLDIKDCKITYICNKEAIAKDSRLKVKAFQSCYSKSSNQINLPCNLHTLEVEEEVYCIRDRVEDKETIYALNIHHGNEKLSSIKKLNVTYPIVTIPVPENIKATYLNFVNKEHFLNSIERTIEGAAILT
jgi:hypothetical protein